MITGNVKYLDKTHIKRLEKLQKRRIPSYQLISTTVANTISKISREISKQIGIIIDRNGKIRMFVIGDEREILWPTMLEFRLNRYRLREVRAIHTHLHNEGLGIDDLTDMAYLRLDSMSVLKVNDIGEPIECEIATYSIKNSQINPEIFFKGKLSEINFDLNEKILEIENQISLNYLKKTKSENLRTLLVNVGVKKGKNILMEELDELEHLAKSANYEVVDKIVQRVNKINPSYVLGQGKFKELIINSLNKNIDKIIFYNELTPAQAKQIAKTVDVEVIDRTILILNIFARRALSKEGKLKVEYAKLKYLLPRVSDKQEALSRIRGGIGLKGPGETKAEVERRKIKQRISHIENELKKISKTREIQRRNISKNKIPVVSIVGYTNAGKSTLLNALSGANVFVENLLFATLDTFKRRIRLPNGKYIILTDTVGFIKNLPTDLYDAFKSTLEELKYSNLIIHLVDLNDPNFNFHIKVVDNILQDIGVNNIEKILVFNKIDKIEDFIVKNICERYNALGISAKNKINLDKLLNKINYFLDIL